jgi:hypothetical protein
MCISFPLTLERHQSYIVSIAAILEPHQCGEGVRVVEKVLGFLFVALWCYGLDRFVHYDHLKGVRIKGVKNFADGLGTGDGRGRRTGQSVSHGPVEAHPAKQAPPTEPPAASGSPVEAQPGVLRSTGNSSLEANLSAARGSPENLPAEQVHVPPPSGKALLDA